MKIKLIILLIIASTQVSLALGPDEILVIANGDIPESTRIAQYYCQKRAVPENNLINLFLGKNPVTSISRKDYNEKVVKPLRTILNSEKLAGKIKCLLTTYGVPLVVEGRGQLEGSKDQLKIIQDLIAQGKKMREELSNQKAKNTSQLQNVETKLSQLQAVENSSLPF